MNVEKSFTGKAGNSATGLVSSLCRSLIIFRTRGKGTKLAHLSSVLRKKVCCNDEIEETIDCRPAYELDEEFE